MKEINSKAFLITSLAILLAIGIVGTTISTPAASAFVENQIPTVVTIPLEGKSLQKGQFLLISDTTPVLVDRAHIALNVPCQDGNKPQSDIAVVAGVAPNVKKVNLTYIPKLSTPTNNCTFHADIPKYNSNAKVTDIAIISLNKDVQFNSGNFVTLSISAVDSEDQIW